MSCYCMEEDCPDCSGSKWDPAFWPAPRKLPAVGDLVKTKAGWIGILVYIKANQMKTAGSNAARPGKYIIYAPEHARADACGCVTSLSGDMSSDILMLSSFKDEDENEKGRY